MGKRTTRYISLFTKSVIALIAIGIFPLLIMGMSIYSAYANSLKETLLSNIYRTTLSVGKSTADLIKEMKENTRYLYNHRNSDYHYFYELMTDYNIVEKKKQVMVTDVLGEILYMNPNIEHVLFVTQSGEAYATMRPPERRLNEEALLTWSGKNKDEGNRLARLIPTHDAGYYGSQDFDFTVSRTIMNTKTIQSADTEVLGTLYIDVKAESLSNIVNETKLEEGSEMYIVDCSRMVFAYAPNPEMLGAAIGDLEQYLKYMTDGQQYIKANGNYFIYSRVPETDWMVIEKIPVFNLANGYREIRDTTLKLIGISVCLLLIIYFLYSKRTSRPIQMLKEAMEEVKGGNLDIRLTIQSNDEIGYLAEGLNDMTQALQSHIQKVYIAEIRQREAEIEVLKAQIRPHYLYNTLDVIRMKAIMNDDAETAEMIDGLSGQLKYLLGRAGDMVPVGAEIENVKNYFKVIRLRYDNRFELDVDVPEFLLNLKVPQLILQPVVENAVKYGLRVKGGKGVVGIQAAIAAEKLEITIMDNGMGMKPKRLHVIREQLMIRETTKYAKSQRTGRGLKNVCDRIKLTFGQEYGIDISSYEGMGTIVKYRLPVTKAEAGEEKDV